RAKNLMKQIQTIAVEHIKISSERSFEEVRRRLEGTLQKLDASIAETLRSGDQKRAAEYEKSGPKLSIFRGTRSWLPVGDFWRQTQSAAILDRQSVDRLNDDPVSALCCSLRAAPGRSV